MEIEEAKQIFIRIGYSYFYDEIYPITIEEIVDGMKNYIMQTTNPQGPVEWKKKRDALFMVSEKMKKEEIDQILDDNFGINPEIYIEIYADSAGFVKRFANELDEAIQEIAKKFDYQKK